MLNRRLLSGGAVAICALLLAACFPTGLDQSFGVDGARMAPLSATEHDRFLAVTPGPAGTYYAAGSLATGTDHAFALARFSADGSLDPTFGGGDGISTVNLAVGGTTAETARGVAVQSDGKIVITGAFEHDPSATGNDAKDTDVAVVRFETDGDLDPDFGDAGVKVLDFLPGFALGDNYFGDLAWGIVSTTDDRTVILGTRYAGAGRIDSDFYLAALDDDGELDATFGTGGVLQVDAAGSTATDFTFDYARNLTLQPDGKLVTASYSLGLDGVTRPVIIRANADGTLDTSFGSGGRATDTVLGNVAEAYKVGLQGDKYVVTGYGKQNAPDKVDLIAYRFNADGTRDLTYGDAGLTRIDNAGEDDRGRNLAVLPDGRTLIVGSGKLNATDLDAFVVLLSRNGKREPSFSNDGGGDHGTHLSDLGGVGDAWFGVTVAPDASAVYIVGYKGSAAGGNDDAAIARISLLDPND